MKPFVLFFIVLALFFKGLMAQDHAIIGKYNYYGYNAEIFSLAGIRSVVEFDSSLVMDNPVAASRLLQNSVSLFVNNIFAPEYFLFGGVVSIPTDVGVFSLATVSANENHSLILSNLAESQFSNLKNLAAQGVDLVQSKVSFSKEIFKGYDFGSSLNFDYGFVNGGQQQQNFIGLALDLALQLSIPSLKNKFSKRDDDIFGFYNLQYGLLIQNLGILPVFKDQFYKPVFLKSGTAFDIVYLPLTWINENKQTKQSTKIQVLFSSKILLESTVSFPGDIYATLANKNTFKFYDLKWRKIQFAECSLKVGYSLELVNPINDFLPLFLGITSQIKIIKNTVTLGYSVGDSISKNQLNHSLFLNFVFGELDNSNPEIKAIFKDSENNIQEGIIIE